MRTVARIMVIVAMMSVVLPSGAAKPLTASQGPELQFELTDGTVITGRIGIKVITFRLPSGNVLKVPVADLKELSVGINKRRGLVEKDKPQSRIRAGESILLGTVTVEEFRIASPYGAATVKLDEVHRVVRPGVRAASGRLDQWLVKMRDKTHFRGRMVSQSLRVQARCGTMIVPLAQIQKTTFAADGKSIRVQCRGSDRIVGTLGPKATISLKTNKGRVDLSVRKIALVACGPLTFKGHTSPVLSVAFSPDSKRLASGGDYTIKSWDTVTEKELLTFKGHSNTVYSIVFSPDGETLASGSSDKTVKLWDTTGGKELFTLKGHTASVRSVAFSPDGKRLASGGQDKTIRLWDTVTGTELLTFKGHSSRVCSIAFSPDGKTLASGSCDWTVKLWNAATGTELLTLKGHSSTVASVAFSPDGKTLASGSLDDTIKIWDPVTGKELLTLKGDSGDVNSVAFSPDGKCLAAGSHDETIKLWDPVTGKELLTLKGRLGEVAAVAFSPDGKRLAVGSYDQTVKILDALDWTKSPKQIKRE